MATAAQTKTFRLVCPKCEKQDNHVVSSEDLLNKSRQTLQCPQCNATFETRVVNIRAKNSKGNKKANKRSFNVRIIQLNEREDVINFENASYPDFELRSKDLVAFTYIGSKLKIVQNFTVNQYWAIKESACYLATYAYGQDSIEVVILRAFRDRVLEPSKILSQLVGFYYFVSPLMIQFFGNNSVFKKIVTLSLKPIVWIVDKSL